MSKKMIKALFVAVASAGVVLAAGCSSATCGTECKKECTAKKQCPADCQKACCKK
jgi:hypothetical protein